jgi:hypothetical protein
MSNKCHNSKYRSPFVKKLHLVLFVLYEFVLHVFRQLTTGYFPHTVSRDDVDEPDPSVEPLLDADECGDKVADLPLRQSDILSLHDETYRDLTEPAIHFTDHRGVFNLRMLDEDGLELDRRHLVGFVLDDIFAPAHDVNGAGEVVVADVSRVDESLRVDGLFRFLEVVQVAFGDGAADADFAALAGWEFATSFWVRYFHTKAATHSTAAFFPIVGRVDG